MSMFTSFFAPTLLGNMKVIPACKMLGVGMLVVMIWLQLHVL